MPEMPRARNTKKTFNMEVVLVEAVQCLDDELKHRKEAAVQ